MEHYLVDLGYETPAKWDDDGNLTKEAARHDARFLVPAENYLEKISDAIAERLGDELPTDMTMRLTMAGEIVG